VTAAPEYQATTTQVCGLYPYVAGSGTPAVGTPVGRHQLWGEVVCLDPLAWLRAGLVTNPGEFVLGQPGVGKSTLVKRQITGAVATGTRVLVLGDTKPDYTMLTEHLGGQVIRIGRGLDRINPLDAGPLGAALRRMSGPDAQALRWEVRSRRLSLLMALCTLVREPPSPTPKKSSSAGPLTCWSNGSRRHSRPSPASSTSWRKARTPCAPPPAPTPPPRSRTAPPT